MPPKSPNRSGISTPTKGKPRDDESELDEEEERLKREQEEKERLEKERKEKLELERNAALAAVKDQEEAETNFELGLIKKQVEDSIRDAKADTEWERYMRCDGRPDPTKTKEINTFLSLMNENGSHELQAALDDVKLLLSLIDELATVVADLEAENEDDSAAVADKIELHKNTALELHDAIMKRYNQGTLQLLKQASLDADSETGNLQKVINSTYETVMLWGNLNKNPRFKSFTFPVEDFTFELPKVLAMNDVAVRVLKTSYDPYSSQSSTFLPKEPEKEEEAVETEAKEGEEKAEEEVKEGGEEGEEEGGADQPPASESVSPDPAAKEPEVEEEGAEKTDAEKPEGEDLEGEEGKSQMSESQPAITISDELDDMLDPDILDLRQFTPLGDVVHVDLVKLPPQPTVVRGWTLTQITDHPLTQVEYDSETPLGRSSSRIQSASGEREEDGKTPVAEANPPIGIKMKLPEKVMFFEEPQVAVWDHSVKHWKTTGITDVTYDETERTISFKSAEFGTFSVLQDSHLNMPFQSWELKPTWVNECRLTVTAAIAEVEIDVKGSQCRLNQPAEDAVAELSEIYNRWMSVEELIKKMRATGVNIFPAEDSAKFVSIQEKLIDADSLYDQIAVLSTNFAFQWSKWNNACNKDQLVFQMAPVIENVFNDDGLAAYLVGADRCYKLALSEFDDSYCDEVAEDGEYHCDLLHVARAMAKSNNDLQAGLEKSGKASDVHHISTVQKLLRATKMIAYS